MKFDLTLINPFVTDIIYLLLLHFSELINFFLIMPLIIDRTNLSQVAAVADARISLGRLVLSLRFKRREIETTYVN